MPTISIRCSDEELELFKAVAESEHRPLSQWGRLAMVTMAKISQIPVFDVPRVFPDSVIEYAQQRKAEHKAKQELNERAARAHAPNCSCLSCRPK